VFHVCRRYGKRFPISSLFRYLAHIPSLPPHLKRLRNQFTKLSVPLNRLEKDTGRTIKDSQMMRKKLADFLPVLLPFPL
jgi:hypothetical protein